MRLPGSLVRNHPGKALVALHALIAQVVEHILGKNEVMGSSPIEGSENGTHLVIK